MQNHGYFGNDSITWRIGKESILMLGGARAVLMQLAHPLVAMGVSEHSSYMTDPFRRTMHTFLLGQLLTFGTTSAARRAARTINRLHTHVQGTLPVQAGGHASGSGYFARDPKLLLWVHATLADTILLLYPMFIGPLTVEEQNRYYQESKIMARLLGLQDADMPKTAADLRAYVHDMSYSNQLAATPYARQIIQQVLYPPIPDYLRPLLHINTQITSALLPPPVRDIYGLEWGPKRERVFELSTQFVRKTLPYIPETLRVLPISKQLMVSDKTPEFANRLFKSAS